MNLSSLAPRIRRATALLVVLVGSLEPGSALAQQFHSGIDPLSLTITPSGHRPGQPVGLRMIATSDCPTIAEWYREERHSDLLAIHLLIEDGSSSENSSCVGLGGTLEITLVDIEYRYFELLVHRPPTGEEHDPVEFARLFSFSWPATSLPVHQNRFQVTSKVLRSGRPPRIATPIELDSDDSGLFYFYSPDNWELLVKVLDGCGVNGHYWVSAAGTTDLAYSLDVLDRFDGTRWSFENEPGRASPATLDTRAFSCQKSTPCQSPDTSPSYQNPMADSDVDELAAYLSPGPVADEEIYRRLVYDTGRIRSLAPNMIVPSVALAFSYSPVHLYVRFERRAITEIELGMRADWACFLARFGAHVTGRLSTTGSLLTFDGRYELTFLAAELERIPGVLSASVNGFSTITGSPPFPILCAQVLDDGDDEEWHYFSRRFHFISKVDTGGRTPTVRRIEEDLAVTKAGHESCVEALVAEGCAAADGFLSGARCSS